VIAYIFSLEDVIKGKSSEKWKMDWDWRFEKRNGLITWNFTRE
jgi:hypothetical protein